MKTKLTIATFLACSVLSFPFLASAQSWSDPTGAPPTLNTGAPINISSADQIKGTFPGITLGTTGSLYLGGGFGVAGNTSLLGNLFMPSTAGISVGTTTTVAGGIVANSILVEGNATAQAFLYDSDVNLKSNISTLSDALDNVMKLRGVSFTWKDSGRKDIGVIAQEVQQVYPELVHTSTTTGLESVEYGNLVGVLIEAVKEENVTVQAQQGEIDQLKQEIGTLKN